MSTNNNRTGKEIKPAFKDEESVSCKIKKLSGEKLSTLVTNNLMECNAATLSNRGITTIANLNCFGTSLCRLDLSMNEISRLSGFASVPNLSLLNVSSNKLETDGSLEELRYLPELRTLNIGSNPKIKSIRSHIVKPLTKLQALIAHECGFERVPFIRFLPNLNSLILSRNSLTEFSMREMGSFHNLTKLSLGHNQLEAFPQVSTLVNLQELRVNNNMIPEIPEAIRENKRLKVLDISHNRISSWANIQLLSDNLPMLTNLSLKGNRLPDPPLELEQISVKEDLAGERIEDRRERRYRRYTLSLFQKPVGKHQKPKVQLIVLDMQRVKLKWKHGFSSEGVGGGASAAEHEGDDGEEAEEAKEVGKEVNVGVKVNTEERAQVRRRQGEDGEKKVKRDAKIDAKIEKKQSLTDSARNGKRKREVEDVEERKILESVPEVNSHEEEKEVEEERVALKKAKKAKKAKRAEVEDAEEAPRTASLAANGNDEVDEEDQILSFSHLESNRIKQARALSLSGTGGKVLTDKSGVVKVIIEPVKKKKADENSSSKGGSKTKKAAAAVAVTEDPVDVTKILSTPLDLGGIGGGGDSAW